MTNYEHLKVIIADLSMSLLESTTERIEGDRIVRL